MQAFFSFENGLLLHAVYGRSRVTFWKRVFKVVLTLESVFYR